MPLNQKEITTVVNSVVDVYKKSPRDFRTGKFKETPAYSDAYVFAVHMLERIRVHAVPGVFPDKLVAVRNPNQTEEEFTYVKNNYKQITLPVFVDLISTIQRAFFDNNWSIEYPEQNRDDSIEQYLDQGLKDTPLQMSMEEWIKGVVPTIKMIDAMGCVAVRPHFIPTAEQEGQQVISGDLFEPVPYYFECSQVVAYHENDWYLFERKDRSTVYIGDREVKEGLIYEFYDRDSVWIITQVGAKKEYQFEYLQFYTHNFNKVQVSRLKGKPDYRDNVPVWVSEFMNVVDVLDDAVLDGCNLRGIKATCVYPYRVMVGDECDYKMEINGQIQCCNGSGQFQDMTLSKIIQCPGCGGHGTKNRVTPYGVMLLKPQTALKEGELKSTHPAMSYVEPSIETPKFLREEISKYLDQARSILHLRTSQSEVKGSEDMTATGKVLDQRALYSFIKNISDQIFTLYQEVVDMISMQRYGVMDEPVVITAPISFDLKDESEYLNDIGDAINKQVPPFVVQSLIYRYLQSLFYNQGEAGAIFELLLHADRLLTVSSEDILLKHRSGLIADWEIILHDSGVSLIRSIIAEDERFLQGKLTDQVARLIEQARKKAAEVKPVTTTPATAAGRIAQILGNNNTPAVPAA